MSITVTTAGHANESLDAERARGLRKMRSVAVGLLLLAATVFLLTLNEEGFLGFVNAGAEASMVGAIADWFAVVALFKHPLGVPVPHTALIPKRKDELGKGLEEFVGENFLSSEVVHPRVVAAQPAAKAGAWLSEPAHAERISSEAVELLRIALRRVQDSDVADFIEAVLVPRFIEEPISPIVGSLLREVVEDGGHHGLVDLIVSETSRWLKDNESVFYDVVVERAPKWVPTSVNDMVISKMHTEMLKWLEDIRREPYHRSRLAIDKLLRELADGLLTDPDVQARMENVKVRFLAQPKVSESYISLWNALRRSVLASLEEPSSELQQRLRAEVQKFGVSLTTDAARRDKLDRQAADLAVFLIDRYGSELTSVITNTIESWDGREASQRIELHVGKDLQFIRINGTIVGGLVGIIIHTFVVVLG